MNRASMREYIDRQRHGFRRVSIAVKTSVLYEATVVTGYRRKAVLRSLSSRSLPARGGKVDRPVGYGSDVAEAARVVHEAAGEPCACW